MPGLSETYTTPSILEVPFKHLQELQWDNEAHRVVDLCLFVEKLFEVENITPHWLDTIMNLLEQTPQS